MMVGDYLYPILDALYHRLMIVATFSPSMVMYTGMSIRTDCLNIVPYSVVINFPSIPSFGLYYHILQLDEKNQIRLV